MKGARHAQDTLYDFIYMKFKDKQNESIMLEAKIIVTPGIGAVLMGRGMRLFSVVMEMFCILISAMVKWNIQTSV